MLMKPRFLPLLLLLSALVLAGCGGGGGATGTGDTSPSTGAMSFRLDFTGLAARGVTPSGLSPASTPSITAVAVALTRNGYANINRNLTVVNNVASGQIDNLALGYWHVTANVYDNSGLIYTGAVDTNVVAGATVQCTILFDPVSDNVAPTGSISISVGLNPMPGYTPINQSITDILFDRANRKLYVYDASSKVVGVYEADNIVRVRDLVLPDSALSVALDNAGGSLLHGYSSGHIHRMTITTGEDALLADALMPVQRMLALTDRYLLVSGPGNYTYSALKTVSLDNGQIVGGRSPYYTLTELVYNAAAKTVYSHHTGVSPTDIHYVKFDDGTGALTADGDSIYHGDYSFGRPLRLINGKTRLATGSGAMFTSAGPVGSDLIFTGSLGYTYVDLASDDGRGKLYLLNSGALQKLLVIDQTTFFTDRTLDLPGTATRLFETDDSIIVFSTKDARPYAKAYPKISLGL